jgi:hypothetical protein
MATAMLYFIQKRDLCGVWFGWCVVRGAVSLHVCICSHSGIMRYIIDTTVSSHSNLLSHKRAISGSKDILISCLLIYLPLHRLRLVKNSGSSFNKLLQQIQAISNSFYLKRYVDPHARRH